MARRVSTELIDRQGSELQRIQYPTGRNAELAEELEVINDDVFGVPPENSSPLILAGLVIRHAHPNKFEGRRIRRPAGWDTPMRWKPPTPSTRTPASSASKTPRPG